MKPRGLLELKNATLSYLRQWTKSGNRVLVFKCPYCEKENSTTAPKNDEVWTTACQCYNCGEQVFKRATRTEVTVTRLGD